VRLIIFCRPRLYVISYFVVIFVHLIAKLGIDDKIMTINLILCEWLPISWLLDVIKKIKSLSVKELKISKRSLKK
jgi:hypothetical protein